MSEDVIIQIKIDPKGGVAGLQKLQAEVEKMQNQFGGAAGVSGKFSDEMKKIGKSALQAVGVMSIMDDVTKAVVTGLIDAINGTNKLASSTKMLNDIQQKAVESTRDEIVQLQLLFDTARDTTLSYGQRQAAIDQLNKAYPDLHKNITMENVLTQQTADAIDAVMQKMVQKVQLQGTINQIAELQNQVDKLKGMYVDFEDTYLVGDAVLGRITDLNDRIKDLYKTARGLQGQNKIDLGGLLGGTVGDVEVKPDKVKVIPKKTEIVWQNMGNGDVPMVIPPEEAKRQGMEFGQMFGAEMYKHFNQPGEKIDFSLINAEDDYKKIQEAAAALLDQNMMIADQVSSVLSPAFDGLFDAIFNNEDPLKAFFNSIGNSIKRLLSQLAAAAIQAGVLSLLTGGAAKGGFSFGKAFGQILGFAQGGLVTGPVSALVGEGMGTNASNPEVVAPLDKLKSFFTNFLIDGRYNTGRMGMSGSVISMPREVWLRQSGRDMVGVIALENMSQGRNG